jgi:hypothetical protein
MEAASDLKSGGQGMSDTIYGGATGKQCSLWLLVGISSWKFGSWLYPPLED